MRKIILAILLSAGCTFSFSQSDSSVTRVFFAFGKSVLSGTAVAELDKVILGNTKVDKIKIAGQTDKTGANQVNDRLSLNRAREVYRYLVAKGFDSSVAHEVVGYGKRRLTEGDEGAANTNQLNRVVVVTSYFKKNEAAVAGKSSEGARQVPQKSFEQQINEGSSNVVLNNLGFVGGRHVLLPTAIPVLENILSTLKKYPSIEIEIQGHICCASPIDVDGIDLDTNEKALSVNRAKAVYDYLLSNGISASRMSYKGFGSRNPLVFPERSEEDFSANRRVEFKIIKQ